MLKPFIELYNLDLGNYISKKPTFKKKGDEFIKTGELDYLNWADCLLLLHQHGAETVKYGNIHNDTGHPMFTCAGKAPYVRLYVEIDGDRRELDYPVIDGSKDIPIEKIEQSDISNASQRGFVKCVAINFGLGLSLWQKEEKNQSAKPPKDDLSMHNILAIKKRVEQLVTVKIQNGTDIKDIYSYLGVNEKQFNLLMQSYDKMFAFEKKLISA